ncbi:superoxide dismutase [Deinococcus arboris]|uniref:superoxide dismutase n=1 Tax=Deinococcus arboris TaxID=2682977 RepID=UPI003F6EF7E2
MNATGLTPDLGRYPFSLPALPYAADALEPALDAQTMALHHSKHHAAYVANLNKALESAPAFQHLEVTELIMRLSEVPANVQEAVRNSAGGHHNHSLFWTGLTPKSLNRVPEPGGLLGAQLRGQFGSLDAFRQALSAAALGRFGSGWAWLVLERTGRLRVMTTPNQDSPLAAGVYPLLGLDVWEHAYYLHYQNRRADYVQAFWTVVNWPEVERRYALALRLAAG